MNEFENETSSDDHIVEISDLDPIERASRFSRMFVALQKRPSLRKRFWRSAIAGSSPVLVIGFGGSDAVLTNFKHAQPPEIGWSKRIILLTQTNYAGTVTFRGGEMHDGTPIWFGMKQHNQGPITTFTLLPLNASISNHTGTDEEWGLTTATMYIARAGCYFLMASWPEGGWIVYFSAGR